MDSGQIFQSNDSREILVQIFQDKKEKNPNYSIRAWSRNLGFKNPSYLSDVIRGKIRLKPKLATKIAKGLDIPEDEKRYFEALVYFENASDDSERDFFKATLDKYRPKKVLKEMDTDDFLSWAKSWVYFMADELPALKDFKEDPAYLSRRIGDDVTPQMVELALSELEAHGLLRRDSKGRLQKDDAYNVQSQNSKERQRIMYERFGKKLIEKGVQAIHEQPLEDVYFGRSVCPVRRKDVPAFRERLRQLLSEIYNKFSAWGNADDLYYYEVSLFNLTPGRGEQKKEGP